MDNILMIFGPVFALATAMQFLIEIADPITNRLFTTKKVKSMKVKADREKNKKKHDDMVRETDKFKATIKGIYIRLFHITVGIIVCIALQIRVLGPLGIERAPALLDNIITGLMISGGTEGINSFVKFFTVARSLRSSKGESN